MIKEEYVSFEVAKLLKEKGFNEITLDSYRANGQLRGEYKSCNYPCPTQQMAMRWLREIHHFIFVFEPASFSGEECMNWTIEIWAGDNFEAEIPSFGTYEEAVEAALKYVLERLINNIKYDNRSDK